jgi:hypothetical protein
LLIKIGAKVVSHGRYVTFQMAEVAVPRPMFQEILSLIAQLRAPPVPVSPGDQRRCAGHDGRGEPRYGQSSTFQRIGAVNWRLDRLRACGTRFAVAQDA